MPEQAASQVDAQLARYRAMRDFAVTAEPSGGSGTSGTVAERLPFVIQKHAATRLHYDFRLGWNGVLKSWACAKGPSYSTADKRLAVEVEDHPMEYGGFEGAIPKGQYGGGTVMVWDQGTWEPLPGTDFDEGLRKGSLKFTLHGQKLEGRWTLVRMGGKAAHEGKPNWLLIKEHDGRERPASAPGITDEAPNSVVTGRSLEAIAAAEDHVWQSHEIEGKKGSANRSRLQRKVEEARGEEPKKADQSTAEAWLDGAPAAPMPGFVPPQLATSAERIPPGAQWLHELKLDGYRVQAHIRDGKATLYTRSGLDWTHRMRAVARACAAVEAREAVLDGELVALNPDGTSSFGKLQAAFENEQTEALNLFVFDLLHLDGRDLRALPLRARKSLLEPLVAQAGQKLLGYSPHLQLDAEEVYSHACSLGAEGILSKQADARYVSGRTDTWLKLKCVQRQEFVVAGFTPPKDKGAGVGSLLLGYYREGALLHCGRCGTGFPQATARMLRARLDPLRQSKPAYARPLDRLARRDAVWVRPELVCEVRFAGWTEDGAVRHASFQGLRADKPAGEVVREQVRQPAADAPEDEARHAPDLPRHETSPVQAAAKRANSRKQPVPDEAEDQALPAKKGSVTKQPAPAPKLRLTHPDKVLDPSTGTTKQQLADYFEAVAPAMLPHLAGRPCSIVRCPDGAGKPCFFQKHIKTGLPKTLAAIEVPDAADPARTEPYISVPSAEALLGLAQLGVLELHPWGSRGADLERPDRLILDLDPDESLPWGTVVESALAIRAFLHELRLETFVKTTGGKGLHLVAALGPRVAWPQMKLFARGLAAAIESTDPKLYLIKMTKAARHGRIFLDWMRNERGATAVAPWSPRARPGMKVAVPLDWDELGRGPFSFTVANFADWRGRLDRDPWAAMRPQPLLPEVLTAVLEQSAASEKPARKR